MTNSAVFRPASAVFVALLAVFTVFGQSERTRQDLSKSFLKFDAVRIDGAEIGNEQPRLSLERDGSPVVIKLEPYDLRAARYRAQNTGPGGESIAERASVSTYKGTVSGEEGSEARININGHTVEGFYRLGNETLFIEPASNYSRNALATDHVIYRMEDVINPEPLKCGSVLAEKIEYGRSLAAANIAQTVQGQRRFEVATEADYEFVNAMGGASQANSEILGILNVIDGLYKSQLGMSVSVVFQHTWTTADPYAGTSSDPILRSFQGYWETNFTQSSTPRDTAHLFSGKSAVLSQGYAFVGSVCRFPSGSYGLSGYVGWAPGKYLITGHELAHNLGADHVDATQGCANTIMNAQLSGSTPLSFCTYSQNQISTYVASYGTCLTGGSNCRFDFDGDSKADLSVFRPSTGVWYLSRSRAGFSGTQFGQSGDKIVSADYDGDGITDVAVYRNGLWFRMMSSTSTFDAVSFGNSSDTPAPADFDGDGRTDVAVFRPSNGTWYELLSSTGGFNAIQFGTNGDVPVPGDYDGDGKADINVFRSSNGVWYRINSLTGAVIAVKFGVTGDKAVTGDFDADGKANVAVWRPSTGVWYIMRADGSYYGSNFGTFGDVPVPADYDGDGKADVAVYRPSTGMWYRLDSGNGAFEAFSFGTGADQPAPAFYIP